MTNRSRNHAADLDRCADLVRQETQRQLELFRHRKASRAADRAAFEARREHGLKARHKAKLAHLAQRAQAPEEEIPPTKRPGTAAA
ncbi:MAG TPA: hypothetical protein VHH15_14950 [Actinophytocola sp.]|nr:hypothetical protein [Actinophytocola sp.]